MPSASPSAGGAFSPSLDQNITGALDVANNTLTVSGTGSVGYATAKAGDTATGGTVTQITSRTTGVTINKLSGKIQTDTTSLGAELAAAFVVTNSLVAIGDVVLVSQRSGAVGVMTTVEVVAVAAGSFTLSVMNGNAAAGVAETGAIVINFIVLKAVSA